MGPRRFERGWDDSPHPVSRFEPVCLLLACQITRREPILRKVRAAMLSSASCHDGERFVCAGLDSCELPYTQGVQGMGLLDSEPGAIPSGSPASPDAYRESEHAQGLDQLVSGGIDGGGIFERGFGSYFHLRVAELRGGLIPFRLITLMTGQRQVRDPVGAAPAPGLHVINLKRDIGLATIGTSVRILDEQVGTYFPSGKLAVLILHSVDFRVLKQLRVEAHTLDL